MSMSHDEYIDLSVDNIDDTKDIEFDTYNDEIRINPVLKTHLDDGDKLVWYKDPTIIATWHSNGRLDVPCFDATDVTISAVNFRILKGHWRNKDEHGVGTESNHWLYDDKPISEYLDLYPDFWKANEVKEVQPKKERKQRQKKETSEKTANVILPRQEDIVKEYKYKSEKYLYDSNYSDTYPDKLRKQATPSWVAEDMIDLLPDEVWRTDSKFLDIYCKSGIFLEVIIDRLMKKVDYSSIGLTTDREIRQYIIENQVYAICWNKWYLDLSRKAINGKSSMVGNIYCIGSEIENMTEDEAKAVLENDKAQSSIDKAIQGIDIRKEFFKNMQIDAVVGNPPYNNDIYIPFVEMGHNLASTCSVFITPAKWQAKGGAKNEEFRQKIVPHMSKIVYYPCAQEVFDIRNLDGISYYIIDKNIHNKKEIKNISFRQKLFNNEADREIGEQLNNNAYSIIKKIGKFDRLKISVPDWTPFGVKSEAHSKNNTVGVKVTSIPDELCVMSGDRIRGYCKIKDIKKNAQLVGKWLLIANGMNGNCYYTDDGKNIGMNKTYILKNNEISCEPYIVIGAKDSEDAIKSLDSYIWCKLTRFLILTCIVGQGIADEEMWRFVPDPGAFDHIFTDEELYKKYNLTEEEINIIESVIKERK